MARVLDCVSHLGLRQRCDIVNHGDNFRSAYEFYGHVDVALDGAPTGAIEVCRALWMGVPLLTLAGSRPAPASPPACSPRPAGRSGSPRPARSWPRTPAGPDRGPRRPRGPARGAARQTLYLGSPWATSGASRPNSGYGGLRRALRRNWETSGSPHT